MAVNSFSSLFDHTDDVSFRAWGSEFSAALLAVGLTKTSDTGQIDWGTVAKPTANTDAGYEIWRFNDALQATQPIFMKFSFGTHSTLAKGRIRVVVGSGSDGAGNLTGAEWDDGGGSNSKQSLNFTSTVVDPTTQAYPSYFCYNSTLGVLTIVWKLGSDGATYGDGLFVLSRTMDPAGTPNAAGFGWLRPPSTYTTAAVNQGAHDGTTVKWSWTGGGGGISAAPLSTFCFVPDMWQSSANPANPNAYVSWINIGTLYPTHAACGHHRDEVTAGTTFSVALLGPTPHTYLSVNWGMGAVVASTITASTADVQGFAVLYE